MDIGQAITKMRNGRWVRRKGWNGKNMHIYLEDMISITLRAGIYRGQKCTYEPCIVMFTAQGKHQPGWLASQADLLANDWEVVKW